MAGASFIQASFLGGEWSQFMQGRVDRPDYRTAMNVCLNGLPIETGTWVRRPGFAFAQETLGGGPAKAIKYDFDQASPYQMIFNNGHLWFFEGTTLVDTNDAVGITSISTATPAIVQLSAARSTWAAGQRSYFTGLGTTSPLIQNRIFALSKVDDSHYGLFDQISNAPIDGSTLAWTATPGALLHRVMDWPTPYTGTLWQDVRSVQTGKVALLITASIKPYVLLVDTDPTPNAFATFTLAAAQFNDGPYLDPDPSGITMTPTNVSGTGRTMTASGVSSTFPGFQTGDTGRHMRILSEPPQWVKGASYSVGDGVRDKGAYYGCVSVLTPSNVPPAGDPAHWSISPQNARWAWLKITGITGPSPSLQCTFDYAQDNFIYAWNPATIYASETWRLGLYSDTTGWPTCGTYSDGRLWLSGVAKNRVDASTANGISREGVVSFGPTGNGLGQTDPSTGTVTDANGISITFDAPDNNPVLWMIPDLQGIICGTQAGEWLIIAPTTGGISPFNIAARRVTKIGCANIEPRRTEHTTIFVQAYGRKIMEYFADVFSGKFTAPHLTYTAKHLTKGGIDEIAYQQELSPTVWARVDGRLIGCAYKRDTLMTSQGPSSAGWHPHTLGSGRVVESISVGPSIGGATDSLTIITNDPNTNIRHVEVLGDILDEGSTLTEARYFDNSVTPTSASAATVAVGRPYGGLVLNGLWHLNGKTVTAWLGGLDCGDYVVAAGSITVPYGDGVSAGTGRGLFTAAFVASFSGAMPMCVGFDYNSDGQIVRPNSKEESGTRAGPAFAKLRRIHLLGVQLEGTQGVSFGTRFTKLDPALFRDDGGSAYPINRQFTGIYSPRGSLEDGYSFDGMICWRANRGYICNVAAIGASLETQDA